MIESRSDYVEVEQLTKIYYNKRSILGMILPLVLQFSLLFVFIVTIIIVVWRTLVKIRTNNDREEFTLTSKIINTLFYSILYAMVALSHYVSVTT